MFKITNKILFLLIVSMPYLQNSYSISETQEQQQNIVGNSVQNAQTSNFIGWAKKVYEKYQENPREFDAKLEKANSDCTSFIIDQCNIYQVIELKRFKGKNQNLFSKIGLALLNAMSEINQDNLRELNIPDEQIADLKAIINNLLNTNANFMGTMQKPNNGSKLARETKIKEITQKLDPAINDLFECNFGINGNVLNIIKSSFKNYLNLLLDETELKDLHSFVTKENGACDQIIAKIKQLWEILTTDLS